MRDDIAISEQQDHRARLRDLVEGARFRYTILAIIAVNAVILGLETSPSVMAVAGTPLHLLDTVILWIFVAELALRFMNGVSTTSLPSIHRRAALLARSSH